MTTLDTPTTTWEKVSALVERLYPDRADEALAMIRELVNVQPGHDGCERADVDRRDAFLICYGDQVLRDGEAPLRTLDAFVERWGEHLSAVHILPFFPCTSDDGFSVVDYLAVRDDLGTWGDVARIAERKDLMIDAVVNHVSQDSAWFQGYLAGDPEFAGAALAIDPGTDLSAVVRPRTSPLLTPFETAEGVRWVWTTFSDDQIDVNYEDPRTLVRILNVLLEYSRRGGSFLRLDAATYMWKEIGTGCASLPRTHDLVKLFRAVLDLVAPSTTLITETNVPHAENISYFGDGRDEAQLVYNFALPPLVLHTLTAQDSSALSVWARTLSSPEGTHFFNFLASHDGIGLRGAEGLLDDDQIEALARRVREAGGRVSLRSAGDRQVPYELNIGYIDALGTPEDDDVVRAARFAAAHAIAMLIPGVPAFYLHSLVGSRSAPALVEETGSARSINRAKLSFDEIARELDDPTSLRSRVFTAIDALLAVRREHTGFDPAVPAEILDAGPELFAVRRDGDGESVWGFVNVTADQVRIPAATARELDGASVIVGSLGGASTVDGEAPLVLEPWGVAWLAL